MDHHAADLFFIPARAQHAAPRNKRLSSLENRQQGRRSRMSDAKTKVFLYIIHKKIVNIRNILTKVNYENEPQSDKKK